MEFPAAYPRLVGRASPRTLLRASPSDAPRPGGGVRILPYTSSHGLAPHKPAHKWPRHSPLDRDHESTRLATPTATGYQLPSTVAPLPRLSAPRLRCPRWRAVAERQPRPGRTAPRGTTFEFVVATAEGRLRLPGSRNGCGR